MKVITIAILVILMSAGCATQKLRLEMAGIRDSEAARSFLNTLKNAVHNDDRDTLVSLVQFPLSIYKNGAVMKTYPDKASLLGEFDRVFTAQVTSAILNAKYEELFVNYQGVMIGDGEVWFDGWGKNSVADSEIRIKAINPGGSV